MSRTAPSKRHEVDPGKRTTDDVEMGGVQPPEGAVG